MIAKSDGRAMRVLPRIIVNFIEVVTTSVKEKIVKAGSTICSARASFLFFLLLHFYLIQFENLWKKSSVSPTVLKCVGDIRMTLDQLLCRK